MKVKFDLDDALFREVCEMSRVKVTPGTGRLLMNGKPFDPGQVIREAFPTRPKTTEETEAIEKPMKMYIMSGMSGSGKTTFAKRFAEENGLLYLNPDVFYAAFNGSETVHEHEFEVWIALFQAIHAAEVSGRDVIVDTNAPTLVDRVQFTNWFPSYEAHLISIIAPYELCCRNNAGRTRRIPDDQMERMWKRQTFSTPASEPEFASHTYYLNEDNTGFRQIGLTWDVEGDDQDEADRDG